MSSLEELRAVLASAPVNRLLGLRLVERDAEHAVLELSLRPDFLQEEGRVHGGILTALADTAAVYVLRPGLAGERSMTSVELKLNFLAPADPDGPAVRATARRVQRGRTIGVCDVELAQDGRKLAKGLFTYLFFDPSARER